MDSGLSTCPSAIPHLIDCFEDDAKRNRAVDALRHFGPDAAAELARALITRRAPADALEGAPAAELLPAETRGLGYGMLGTVNGVGDLFSSIIVGVLLAQVSVTAGLVYAAVLSLAGAVLIPPVR
jgi:hypothetical protein